jgi:hexosaminidase
MYQKLMFPLIAMLLLTACNTKEPIPMDLNEKHLIPKPTKVEATGSSFEITAETTIFYEEGKEDIKEMAQFLVDFLQPATGMVLTVEATATKPSNGIYLHFSALTGTNETYALEVTESLVNITSSGEAGLFYAIQTLRQLLPASIEATSKQDTTWLLPSGKIEDSPNYAYRGAMLDVSRHFFQVQDVKKFIDYIAMYKMNKLHLHLSDDQGWRIEIKSWPKLTEIGGSTEVGGGSGGFYTQEEYKDIVAYAKKRQITIIPEIDMPGHTNAALASYPELNCDDKARELYTGTKVGFSTFCTDKEVVYEFIDDVIRELAEMTPGEYIHIGGDESHVTPLEDYIPFINRVQKIVEKYGKKVIGWDEIAHAELLPNTVVQWWAKADNAKKGIAQGAKVLVSPATKAYLDMQYDSTTHLGLHWAAYIEVDSAYIWDPATMVDGIKRDDIIGVESPLWSETITNLDEIEYMIFPRIIGHAEIGWTDSAQQNWEDYRRRLAHQKERMDILGIDFYKSPLVDWDQKTTANEKH